MAKRGRRGISTTTSLSTATRSRVPRHTVSPVVSLLNQILDVAHRRDLRLIEDRRTYHPMAPYARPVVSVTVGKAARIEARQNPRHDAPSQTKGQLVFADPHLPLCARRKERREVLFAKGVGGSKRPQKRPRKSEFSSISCK